MYYEYHVENQNLCCFLIFHKKHGKGVSFFVKLLLILRGNQIRWVKKQLYFYSRKRNVNLPVFCLLLCGKKREKKLFFIKK